MSVASTPEWPDVLRWIRSYDVRWELAPLDELMPGRGLQQTGYVLRLFGRLPPDPRDRDQRLVEALYQRLRALATEALRVIPLDFRVNVQPFPRVVVARNSPFAIDVELTALLSPARADDGPTPEERRQSIGVIEAKLRSLGAKRNPEPPCERLLRGARFGG